MKTRRMFLVALCGVAMLTGTSSCKKEKNENLGEKMRIEATLNGADGNAKTHLEGGKVVWNSGDAFKLFPTEGAEGSRFEFQNITGDEGRTAVFEGTRPGAAPFYACYPCDEEKLSCDQHGVFKFQIPETQPGVPETVDEQPATTIAGPMVGYMGEGETRLTFQNAMSWLKVGLKGNVTIKRVTLTDNGGNKLNGTLTVTCNDEGGNFTFTSEMNPDAGTNKLVIVSNDGFELKSDKYTYFWFQVPAGSLANLNLSAYLDENGQVKVLDLTKTITHTTDQGVVPGINENTILTAEVSASITLTEATVTTKAGCSNENIYQLNATVTGKDDVFTTYMVGVCYNYADGVDPTIDNCVGHQEIGTFTIENGDREIINYDLVGLERGREYKICAYATNGVYAYSNCMKIVGGNVPLPLPTDWTNGKNPHPFTVGSDVVYFSQGNLQYIGSAPTPYWQFAEYQCDFIGNGQNGSSASIDRDLFGWGTSGWDNGNYFYQPYCTSNSQVDPYTTFVGFGYGPVVTTTDEFNLTGDYANADWGVYNAISNGGNTPNKWRTLTHGEWDYLINTRKKDGNLLYGEGKVGNCTPGLIILPDDWVLPGDLTFSPGHADGFEANFYTYSEWAQMEAAGAVFLPAAGQRNGDVVTDVGPFGCYWSSSAANRKSAYHLNFYSIDLIVGLVSELYTDKHYDRYEGHSVRLVSDIPPER